MIEFRRNKRTGIVEAYKNGKKISNIITMGDMIKKEKENGRNKDSKK